MGEKGVDVIDPYKVRVNFQSFWSHAQIILFSTFWESPPIFSKKAYDALGPDKMRTMVIGTGPYSLVKWEQGNVVIVKAVENHWRKTGWVDQIEFREVLEPAARRAMLETGEVDITTLVLKDQEALLTKGFARAPGVKMFIRDAMSFPGNYWEKKHHVTGKDMNRTIYNKPWIGNPDDPVSMEKARKVRWALSMAFDREGINQAILLGLGRPYGMYELSVDSPLWDKKYEVKFDPEGARKLMAEAGYADGFDVEIWSGPSGDAVPLLEAIAASWQKELKVKATLNKAVYSAFRPSIIDRTNTTIWRCGDGNSYYMGTWPKGLLLSTLAGGGYSCNNEDKFFAEHYIAMAKSTDPAQLQKLAYEHFDYLYNWRLVTGTPEFPYGLLYNPKKISEWKQYPEGKAWIFNGFNSPERIKLAGQ
jgi:ABC-type transport system substrate-binding protein